MSFIIQGVDLPKGYNALHMRVQSDGVVRYIIEGDDPVHIIDGARAIQLPKGHGRLIDADALETVFQDMAKCEWNQKAFPISWAYAFEDTIDEIQNAPTILEAEEE